VPAMQKVVASLSQPLRITHRRPDLGQSIDRSLAFRLLSPARNPQAKGGMNRRSIWGFFFSFELDLGIILLGLLSA
jgi:hypothetical protein